MSDLHKTQISVILLGGGREEDNVVVFFFFVDSLSGWWTCIQWDFGVFVDYHESLPNPWRIHGTIVYLPTFGLIFMVNAG